LIGAAVFVIDAIEGLGLIGALVAGIVEGVAVAIGRRTTRTP